MVYDIRDNKRILDYKNWLLKKSTLIKNKGQALKDKKSQLLSCIKFRYGVLKNIQVGMQIFFSHNNKYAAKDFEYLDIFNDGSIKNNPSIGENIVWQKNIWKKFHNFSGHLRNLKTYYFNKRLWSAYKIVKRKYSNRHTFNLSCFQMTIERRILKSIDFLKLIIMTPY